MLLTYLAKTNASGNLLTVASFAVAYERACPARHHTECEGKALTLIGVPYRTLRTRAFHLFDCLILRLSLRCYYPNKSGRETFHSLSLPK